MSTVQIQRAIFTALPQLSEVQLNKLFELVNSMVSIQKPPVAKKAAAVNMREVKIFTDESFELDSGDFYVALPFKTFVVQAHVSKVEKLKPAIILE